MSLLEYQEEIERIASVGGSSEYLFRRLYLKKFRKEKAITKKDYKRIEHFLGVVVAINSFDEMIIESSD